MAMDIITKDKKQITWRGWNGVSHNSRGTSNIGGSAGEELQEEQPDGGGGGGGEQQQSNTVRSSSSSSGAVSNDGARENNKSNAAVPSDGVLLSTTPTMDDGYRNMSGLSRRERVQQLQQERTRRVEEIERKRECLQELMVQNVCFRNLLGRNHARETAVAVAAAAASGGGDGGGSVSPSVTKSGSNGTSGRRNNIDKKGNNHQQQQQQQHLPPHHEQDEKGNVKEMTDEKIPLPFIIVNTHSKAEIQCEMCPQQTDVSFDFSLPFEINDDNEILKRLGMNYTSKAALQRTLPMDLYSYCDEKGLLQSVTKRPKVEKSLR